MEIHHTAIVAEGAELSEGVRVGPYSVIGPKVKVGPGTQIHAHVTIDGNTEIGPECRLFPGVVLGTSPQDRKDEPYGVGRLVIGARNVFREYVTIHPGTHHGGGLTRIGDDNYLLVGVHIGHDCKIGNDVVLSNLTSLGGHVEIHDRVNGGAMSAVHQYGRVGTLAMLGAGAMASKDVPPYGLVQGDRANLIGLNRVGLERCNTPDESVNALRKAYRILFFTETPFEQEDLVERVKLEVPMLPEVRTLLEFVQSSKRGVCLSRKVKLHGAD